MARFLEQVDAFTALVMSAPPSQEQQKDLDFLLTLGQLFTQVVYAQLVRISRSATAGYGRRYAGLDDAHIDWIFAVFVQDVSEIAVGLHGQASATDAQREAALGLIRRRIDPPRRRRSWTR